MNETLATLQRLIDLGRSLAPVSVAICHPCSEVSLIVALATRVKRAGKEFIGDQRELYLLDEQQGRETPYERLLSDAMAGDGAIFAREDAVDAAWAAVGPVLKKTWADYALRVRQLGASASRRTDRRRRRVEQSRIWRGA